MKTRNIIAAGFAILLSACGSTLNLHEEANRVSESIKISKEDSVLVNATANRLAFKMLPIVAKGNDKMVFVSPLGLYYALSMADEGAAGKTQEELSNVLNKSDENRKKVAELYKNVILKDASNRGYKSIGMDPKREQALPDTINASWLDVANEVLVNGVELDEGYKNILADQYFGTTAVGGNDLLTIRNELTFNGQWLHEFRPGNTKKRPFTHEDGKKEDVTMMGDNAYYRYSKGNGYQMIAIPYTNDYYMDILLPDSGIALSSVVPGLNEEVWAKHIADMDIKRYIPNDELEYDSAVRRARLWLPKFSFEKEYQMNALAHELGVKKSYTNTADFSNMLEEGQPRVNIKQITQKVKIDLSEKKTVAMVITVSVVELSSIEKRKKREPIPPIVFHCDHPFAYFITDHYGAIAFMGIYR